jgi:hypothetical protein
VCSAVRVPKTLLTPAPEYQTYLRVVLGCISCMSAPISSSEDRLWVVSGRVLECWEISISCGHVALLRFARFVHPVCCVGHIFVQKRNPLGGGQITQDVTVGVCRMWLLLGFNNLVRSVDNNRDKRCHNWMCRKMLLTPLCGIFFSHQGYL